MDLNGLSVLVVGISYLPETSGVAPYSAAFAETLQSAGAQVHVVTGVPHYPAWRVADEYRRGHRWEEVVNGIRVSRRRHWVPKRANLVGRAAMEATFLVRATWATWRNQSDVIVAVTPSLSAVGAALIARRGRPVGVIVQDLVGNAAGQSGTTSGRVSRLISSLEYSMLAKADLVGVIADRFGALLQREGVPASRIANVANFTHIQPASVSRDEARLTLGWPVDQFRVVHTGNMGMKQGLGVVVEAARQVDRQNLDVQFVLVGDGNQREQLVADARGVRSISFVAPLTEDQYPLALAAANLLLVNERLGVMEMSLPSKLTSYAAADRPILAAVQQGGITHEFIVRTGIAMTIEPGDAEALLDGIQTMRASTAGKVQASHEVSRKLRYELSPEAARERYVALANALRALAADRALAQRIDIT